MRVLNSMSITARKPEVLATLHENREKHGQIVKEAREGYVKKARAALEERLKDLESGKLVGLHFSLRAPQDHTKVYDVAIKMLEMHTGDEIELDSGQVQSLINDTWEWTDSFLATNSSYSGTAREEFVRRQESGLEDY